MRTVRVVIVALVLVAIGSPVRADSMWETLQDQDGIAVLYRHALAPGGGDPAGFDVDDCGTQRNLSADGRRQAVRMGKQLRERNVPVARVVSSPWCRARETAELMRVGDVDELKRLGSVFQASSATAAKRQRATERLLRRHAGRDGVLVVSFHQANIIDLTGIAPTSGEGIVVRYNRQRNDLEVLGRLPAPSTNP
jgi:phosphohistidine phosphatase SixA